jgi:glycosyltransferase involved in cell wall biosynthesis
MKKYIFYCGKGIEQWSPKSIKTGCGGSEEAVIYLARELAKLGIRITIYNSCGKDAGIYDGVLYKDYKDYQNEPCDVTIFWRQPQTMTPIIAKANSKKKYFWLHDTVSEQDLLPLLYLVTKFMPLSTFHRNLYPNIPDHKIYLTQNGVELSQFDKKIKRNPKKIIWTSSYDRGLKELLEVWTMVKMEEPDAELHIYYGWDVMDKIRKKQGREVWTHYLTWKDVMIDLMKQEGVYEHGRIGQEKIAEEYLSSGVWAYPTWWPEISCISAMKAQVGGAIPVVIPTAAVSETVNWGFTTNISYDHHQQGLPEKTWDIYAQLVIRALNEKTQEKIRPMMMEKSRKLFSWVNVAKQWQKEFDED